MTTIVLAAGLSSRMGTNKLLLPYGGKPVLCHVMDKLLPLSERVIVVTGHERDIVEKLLEAYPVELVYNKEYEKGQGTSVRTGIERVVDDGFLVIPGDLPLISEEDVRKTIEVMEEHGLPARSSYRGIPGHPVVFRKEDRNRLLAYSGSTKEYLKEEGCLKVPSSIGSVFDLDTPGKYQALLDADGDLAVLDRSLD